MTLFHDRSGWYRDIVCDDIPEGMSREEFAAAAERDRSPRLIDAESPNDTAGGEALFEEEISNLVARLQAGEISAKELTSLAIELCQEFYAGDPLHNYPDKMRDRLDGAAADQRPSVAVVNGIALFKEDVRDIAWDHSHRKITDEVARSRLAKLCADMALSLRPKAATPQFDSVKRAAWAAKNAAEQRAIAQLQRDPRVRQLARDQLDREDARAEARKAAAVAARHPGLDRFGIDPLSGQPQAARDRTTSNIQANLNRIGTSKAASYETAEGRIANAALHRKALLRT